MVRTTVTDVQKARIRAMYVDEGQSTEQIARTLGFGPTAVRRALRRLGVPRRTSTDYPAVAGQDHPAWKGGVHENYYRKLAFAHYGRFCQRCGATGRLDVHHQDRDRTANRVENLEPLCKYCHRTEHDGDRWLRTITQELLRHATPQRRKRGLPKVLHCPSSVLSAETP